MTDAKTTMCEQHLTVYNEPLNTPFYSSLLEHKFLVHLSAGYVHYPDMNGWCIS